VGWSPALGYAKVDAQVGALTEAAAKVFDSSLGCKVETADPGFESPWEWLSILVVMGFALPLRGFLPEWDSRMDPDLVTIIRNVERLGPTDYGEALAKRFVFWDTARKFFDRFDLLLTPTMPIPAFEAGRLSPEPPQFELALLLTLFRADSR
jgi:aspartyl-tRNA(Asn)/glutamyl-tRNA(Gln) amidotransferase subunit A